MFRNDLDSFPSEGINVNDLDITSKTTTVGSS